MKLVSMSRNELSIEPLARKDGKEQQTLTLPKIHFADQVGWLVSLESFFRLLNKYTLSLYHRYVAKMCYLVYSKNKLFPCDFYQ